ncbi:hypothetical protein D3C72_1095650 [compost metagenome]
MRVGGACLATLAPLRGQARNAIGQQRHQRNDGNAQRQMPMACVVTKQRLRLEQLLHQHQRHRADHRAAQAGHAAQNHHQQHQARLFPSQQLRRDETVFQREQKARQAGQRGAHHVGGQLVRIRGIAGRAHALFVDADAGQCRAKGRPPQQRQKAPGQRQAGQHEEVERGRVAQVEGHPAAQGQLGPEVQVDAVAAAADLGIVEYVVRHLRESQRDHDEVDAAGAQRQRAGHERIGRRRQQGGGQ